MRKAYVSIGALTDGMIAGIVGETDYYVVSYEPSKSRYAKHKAMVCDRVEAHKKAVWSGDGTITLHNTPSPTVCDSTLKVGSEVVDAVGINAVLGRFDEIAVLNLNCEGAEIAILDNADPALLVKCEKILVEFHVFRTDLECSQEDVDRCVTRLSKDYECKMLKEKYPIWEFTRKES